MANAGIKLTLTGFDELIAKIENAGGKAEKAVEKAMKVSADIVDTEMRSELNKATQIGIASRMPPPKIESHGGRVTAYVGFEKGEYNPNKLSDGYKAVFLNYGTPHRSKHGQEKARGFVIKAKRKATPKVKKQQQETLDEILKGLEK